MKYLKKCTRLMLSVIMFVLLITANLGVLNVYASAGNPYSQTYTDDQGVYHPGNCTWQAWEEAYKRKGIKLPNWGNAGNWCKLAKAAGYNVVDWYEGYVPPNDCIMQWSGHVGWIISADSVGVNIIDGNIKMNGSWVAVNEQWWSWAELKNYRGNPVGCIILDGASGNRAPVGCIDFCEVRNNNLYVQGWVYDPDEPSKSLVIHVYSGSNLVKAITASNDSPDVNSAYSISGKHRFVDNIALAAGNHTIRIYAIDSQGGGNPQLGSGPNKTTDYSITISSNICTVVFDPNGGSACGSKNIESGKCFGTFPYTTTKTGSTFDGWYTSKTGGERIGVGTPITKSMTLYAHWIPDSYTVSLSSISNGTASLSKTSASEGDEITVTTTPSTGYTLDAITVNGTAISGNKFTMPAKNTTVAVTFKKATYTITLGTVNNGTASLSKTSANYGDQITVTATPATGYELDSIKVNGSAISGNKFTMPAKNTSVEVTFKQRIHILTKVSSKAATCTEDGNITYYVCKDTECGCKKIYSDAAGQNEISLADTVLPATGHDCEKVAAKEATCTEEGHLAYWKCTKCGKMFADADGKNEISAVNVTVEALSHDIDHIDYVNEKPATYKEDGHKGYYLCPRCGKKFKDPNCKVAVTDADLLIPKLGAAVQGEEATVDNLKYQVTYQATDGTGTVTVIGVDTKTASVSVPANVEIKGNTYKVNVIGPSAFAKNTVLTNLYIGANVTAIADNAFSGCSQLVKVSGGANLKSIGSKAFAGCPKLKSFKLSSKVLWKIGPYAFSGDKSLKTIYIKSTTKITKSGVKKSLKGSKVKTVKVKKSKVKKYKKYFKKSNSGRKVKVKK